MHFCTLTGLIYRSFLLGVSMRYALGVDGGASKTHAIVIEETGRVRGFGEGGASNYQTSGLENAKREISKAVKTAFGEAGTKPGDIELGYFCLAGADLAEDYDLLQKTVEQLSFTRRAIVKNDTMAALRSGLTRSWGVVVVCGTGFNAAGRSKEGIELVLPGLGTISGDWGGGGALSHEVIRVVMRAWDGRGQSTLLSDMVFKRLGVPNAEILISKLRNEEIDHRSLLDLVPLLFEAGQAGDVAAREIIVRMGTEIGITANALLRRLSFENEEVEVVFAGGVFKNKGGLMVDTGKRIITEEFPKAKIKRPTYEPVVGASLSALEDMGIIPDASTYSLLAETIPSKLSFSKKDQPYKVEIDF